MVVDVVANTQCLLGEGPIWHPLREELFWFDIHGFRLYACKAKGENLRHWILDEKCSAAAWCDENTLLIASSSAIGLFNIDPGEFTKIADLEHDNSVTRTNDGRADRHGGFWIGTMGEKRQNGIGTLYRVTFANEQPTVTILREAMTIPNSICFSPSGDHAYLAETAEARIDRWNIDPETGVPIGDPEPFVDLSGTGMVPDGSVVDEAGCLWNAQYNGWRVVRYAPDGSVDRVVELPTQKPTCPAFGGDDLRTLFITTARQDMSNQQLAEQPTAGNILAIQVDTPGLVDPALKV